METEIETLENEAKQLEINMASTDFYKDEQKTAIGIRRYQEIKVVLTDRYRVWEEAGQQLEILIRSLKKE